MSSTFDFASAGLFVLVVFPGLVSTTIYRLLMPARALDWGSALLQGSFYSAINFVLGLLPLYSIVFGYDPLSHPLRYVAAAILVLFITPILWPLVLVWIFKSKRIAGRIQIPYPTAWDYFFNRCEAGFVLIHLSNGKLIGGYWGANSYAGSFPNDGDIYLEAMYAIDERGHFGEPMPNTRGALLSREQYLYLEMFSMPKTEA